jgi:glycosyltransferase involved in cell wall biosynthesis
MKAGRVDANPMKPFVSILMPAFNAGPWIRASIQSALDQTWPEKEVTVVDDGSSDQTLSIAREFISQGVVVVTQPNQGAAAARNKAYSLSHGDYIQWLDADDLLAPDKISKQMELLSGFPNPRILLSAAWGHFYYRVAKAKFLPSPLWCDLSPLEWLSRKVGQGCFMQTATWLVSRELTETAGPWNTKLLGDDDGEYFCRVMMKSDGIRFAPESRVFYRATDGSRLSFVGYSERKLEAHFHSMQLHIQYLRSLADNEKTRAACVNYLQRYLYYFHRVRPDIVRQIELLAAELGGKLAPPRTRWKYYWIQKLWGWDAAKRAQFFFPGVKASLLKRWDKMWYRFEGNNAA